jgi:hypothetical protein
VRSRGRTRDRWSPGSAGDRPRGEPVTVPFVAALVPEVDRARAAGDRGSSAGIHGVNGIPAITDPVCVEQAQIVVGAVAHGEHEVERPPPPGTRLQLQRRLRHGHTLVQNRDLQALQLTGRIAADVEDRLHRRRRPRFDYHQLRCHERAADLLGSSRLQFDLEPGGRSLHPGPGHVGPVRTRSTNRKAFSSPGRTAAAPGPPRPAGRSRPPRWRRSRSATHPPHEAGGP